MNFNYTVPWGQLRKVCVGSVYPESFFAPVKDNRIKSSLNRILNETQEDLDHIAYCLQSMGICVYRPQIPTGISVLDFLDSNNKITKTTAKSNNLIPRPPLQLRDSFFVCDNFLYQTRTDGTYVQNMIDNFLGQKKDLTYLNFDAPLVTVYGNTLFVDTLDIPELATQLSSVITNKKIYSVASGGHNDAVFSIIKEGVLITLEDPSLYADTFPNWNILHCPSASWQSTMKDFRLIKKANGKHWWSPDSNNNMQFVEFVDTWCTQWVGKAAETVFDVNCLVINENLVMINNHNKEVEDFLKKHKIDVIVAPLRHRFFWDGGIHCVTNDLFRDTV